MLRDSTGAVEPEGLAAVAPERDPRVPRFIDALLDTMAASRRNVCLIAGVDLARVSAAKYTGLCPKCGARPCTCLSKP